MDFSTSNINTKWLDNIYENLKNLEKMERLAYEGCESLIEYISLTTEQRRIVIGEVQYKNLRMIVTEFKLLIADLSPVIESKIIDEYLNKFKMISEGIDRRELFVQDIYNASGKVMGVKTKPFFNETLTMLSDLKIKLLKNIGHILYIKEEERF